MRLFVALEIPRPLRDELARRSEAFHHDLPKARWVRPEAMHLTLAFLGKTDPDLLPNLHAALAAACGTIPPFSLRLADTGAFPPRGKARILWAGLNGIYEDVDNSLASLRSRVVEAVSRVTGAVPEKRRFHPHVTLARCSKPWPRGAVHAFQQKIGDLPSESFLLRQVTLFESELLRTGARYLVVRNYPLATAISAVGGQF